MSAPPDLTRLTAAERQVLLLLAEGHTTKSVATTLDRSVNAVNERLREARRKTGVGSSRELARLLRTQQNRDEQIGMGEPAFLVAAPVGASRRTRLLGASLMLILIGALAAAALHQRPTEVRPPRSLLDAATGTHYGEVASWHAETIVQPRNAAWADAYEAVLRRRYAAIAGVDPAALRIDCRESKCEVIGRSIAGASASTLQRGMDELGAPTLRGSLTAQGLQAAFTHCDGDTTKAFSFLAYWVSPDD